MKKLICAAFIGVGAAALASASEAQSIEHLESGEIIRAAITEGRDTTIDAGDEIDRSDASDADESDADAGDAGPPLPSFAAEPFPEGRTPRPTRAEWIASPRVGLDGNLPSDCEAWRVREWMRVRCTDILTLSIRLLGGDKEGVVLKLDAWDEKTDVAPNGGELIFPIHRGDRRVFEWLALEQGYKGMTSMVPFFVLEESWLGSEEKPTMF